MKRWEMTDMELICALRAVGAGMIPGLEDPLDDLPEEVALRLRTGAEDRLMEKRLMHLDFDGSLKIDGDLYAELKEAAETKEWDVYLRKAEGKTQRFFASDHIFLRIGEDGAALLYEAEDARGEAEAFLEVPEYCEMLTSQPVRINTEQLRKEEVEAILEGGCPPEVLAFFAEAAGGGGEEWQWTQFSEGADPTGSSYLVMGSHIMQVETEYDLDGEWLVLTPLVHEDILPPLGNIYDIEADSPEEEEEA